ncbi:eaa protein [Klebsiella aerogenes]|uniref:eaa protein n=1 Tax=Klebsiella aerogenes TaxID=548 RepID=UPI003CF559FA
MNSVKDKIMQVMKEGAAQQDATLGSGFPFRLATWNIRSAMERKFPGVEWKSADLRKELVELAKEGLVFLMFPPSPSPRSNTSTRCRAK